MVRTFEVPDCHLMLVAVQNIPLDVCFLPFQASKPQSSSLSSLACTCFVNTGAHSWMCLQLSAKRDAKVSCRAELNFAHHICQLAQRHQKNFPQRLFVSRLRHICCCFSILIAGAVGESRPLENGSDSRVCSHPVETSHSCDSINNKKKLVFSGGGSDSTPCVIFFSKYP